MQLGWEQKICQAIVELNCHANCALLFVSLLCSSLLFSSIYICYNRFLIKREMTEWRQHRLLTTHCKCIDNNNHSSNRIELQATSLMMTHWTVALTYTYMHMYAYASVHVLVYIYIYIYISCACTPTLYRGKHIWCTRLTRDASPICVRARFAAEHMYTYYIHIQMACTIYIWETRIDDSAICFLSVCVCMCVYSYINHIKHIQCNHYANINNLGFSSMCADT